MTANPEEAGPRSVQTGRQGGEVGVHSVAFRRQNAALTRQQADELRGLLARTEIAEFSDPGIGMRIGKVIAQAAERGWSRYPGDDASWGEAVSIRHPR